uniref:Quino protein alcohol dehydrogenase-like protein n=2 Tax=Rhizophagus irregularis TaxID=588596 RepID=U9STZ4_RHIID
MINLVCILEMQYGDLLIRLKNSRKCCKLYYDATTPEKKSACHDPNNFLDSILALDIEKGDVKWVTNLPGYDSWTVACITTSNPENCPVPTGTDYSKIINLDIILYQPQSGITWSLNAATGEIIWLVASRPGNRDGGSIFGCATGGKRYFVSQSNSGREE